MTLENAKKLYEHYVEKGMSEEAADIKKNIDRKEAKLKLLQPVKEVASDGKKSKG